MPLDPAILADLLAAAANAAAYGPATPIYLAAMTTYPPDSTQGTECTGDGYVRCMVTPSSAFALVSGEWVNSSDIVFAAGRVTVPYLRYLRRVSGGRTFTMFLQDPRTGLGAFWH